MQKHFSAWYFVVLEKRVRLGKAAALCDWRRQLRAWRVWRALVWVRRKEREAKRTEEELRLENRYTHTHTHTLSDGKLRSESSQDSNSTLRWFWFDMKSLSSPWRRCQLAEESDRRRILRRCLSDWRLWCRMERERRELLSQQEETRRKMAALIDAAVSGKLTPKDCTEPPITVQPESTNQPENTTQLVSETQLWWIYT